VLKKKSVGLDIGYRWIRLVGVRKSSSRIFLDKVVFLVEKKQLSYSEDLGLRLKTVLKSLGLSSARIIVGVCGQGILIKRLNVKVKAADEEELEEVVFKEAKQHIPFELKDVVMDYAVVKRDQKKGEYVVFLVVCKDSVVEPVGKMISGVKLKLDVVDVDVFALANVFEFNYPERKQDVSCLLDVGENRSILELYGKGELLFFREMPFGWSKLVEKVATVCGENYAGVEKILLQGDDYHGPNKDKIVEVVDKEINFWSLELKKVFAFVQSNYVEWSEVEVLFLSGIGVNLKTIIAQKIGQEFNLKLENLDPWRKIEKDVRQFDFKYLDLIKSQMAIATGLALRGVL